MLAPLKSVVNIYRSRGAKSAAISIWWYLIFSSPLSILLQPIIPDSHTEKLKFYKRVGYWPRVKTPRTFNEKILHRKFYTDNELFTKCADKWRVRRYVADKVGEDVLNDVYWVGDDPENIPFNDLPEKFVIKATHGWGWVRLIDGEESINRDMLKEDCKQWLSSEFGAETNEYWYRDIKPRIIIERLISDEKWEPPLDYKFFVFHGEVKYIEVDFERFSGHEQRFFDRNWNTIDMDRGHPRGPPIDAPEQFDDMVDVAEQLGGNFDFVRVDLYNPNGDEIIFGELTFAPAAGYGSFQPEGYDFKFGSHW